MNQLVGSTITACGHDGDTPYLDFKGPNGATRALISCDPEGNGPGFIFGLPLPKGPELEARRAARKADPTPEKARELQLFWEDLYYSAAVGGEVLETGTLDSGDPYLDDFPFLDLKVDWSDDPITLEISQDEEGNGPGALQLLRVDEPGS